MWQPIETAPKDERCVVYRPSAPSFRQIGVDERREIYRWSWAHSRPAEQPTHWMPLPPPPAGEAC